MKILVPIKRVLDYHVKVRVKTDNTDVDLNGAKMSINPFDEIAVEEAIRLKEAGKAEEIIVLSVGPTQCQETLRTALAMGADRGIHVATDDKYEPLNIAKVIKAIAEQEQPGLILMGKQAIDDDYNQTGQILSALLDWPQASFVSKLDVNGNTLQATREVDGGLETIELQKPAVITTDLRLNEPRYASLPNIMKAKRKELKTIDLQELGLELRNRLKRISVNLPPERPKGIFVADVKELVEKLANEAKVI